jgi:hypothetical protein
MSDQRFGEDEVRHEDTGDDGRAGESARRPVVGGDPQVPIGEHDIVWTAITTSSGYIGYVLSAGASVSTNSVETNKGDFDIAAGDELWFSASQNVEDVASANRIDWTSSVFTDPDDIDGLITAINGSDGLADQSGTVDPDVTGPSGGVLWSTSSLPSGVKSFQWTAPSGTKWQLSLAQSSGTLSRVCWSTDDDDSSMETTATPLPAAIGADGTTTTMTKKNNPSTEHIYDDYSY